MYLADDGNYRETRWFTPWKKFDQLEQHVLPDLIRRITDQRSVPFGIAILVANDATVAAETCEELFTPDSPHILFGLNGAEILLNGSGSHHNLRKLALRLDLIRSATAKGGGAYLCP
jgi:NAD+ synthase (glutamine-hydrolysing)